jgi:hypothetical protein
MHAGLLGSAAGQASKAGGAGHALLFADHAPVLKSFKARVLSLDQPALQ